MTRVGIGYDVHRIDRTRTLVLGGVTFEGEPGLAGHSDADVLLHAIIDALLGASGLGDIGGHFPPEDEQWRGANSVTLLVHTLRLVKAVGLGIDYVDATVIAERPKLAPHFDMMRSHIATALEIDPSRVSVKATTPDGVGAIGRREGMAAMAIAALREG
jgi:2-C-methyl-D-erythritol 2,4-cyclodiphosphate synthase